MVASEGGRVLTPTMREFWDANGYVIIPNAVPSDYLEATLDAIWEFLEMDPEDPESWYRYPARSEQQASPISTEGMVEFYHHQALWDNRQHPRIYQAFSELHRQHRLWLSYDRVNMKPPARDDRPGWSHRGMLHWDLDSSADPISFQVQGVLYLTDTAANQGGFQCIPGFHRDFYDWVKTQPADRHPRYPVIDHERYPVLSVPGNAGDLLIWHSLLVHGNGHNESPRPRLAQYISMNPNEPRADDVAARRRAWRQLEVMPGAPGDPRGRERQTQQPAELSELGQRLLGVLPWDPAP